MPLHAPSPRREKVVVYADNGGGKSSVTNSIADWMVRTKSERKIWLLDSNNQWIANRATDGSWDGVVRHIPVDVERFGGDDGWAAQVRRTVRPAVHEDDWAVVDMQSVAWEGAQRWYWGQKSGNDSLAELWLKNSAQSIAGDHGTNWGVIKKFYFEFTNMVTNLGCHVLFLATAKKIQKGDTVSASFYGTTEYMIEGEHTLKGEGYSVIFAFEANGRYRYTTVKEMGPLGKPKRELLLNEDVTDRGFVPGYLFKVAGWRP